MSRAQAVAEILLCSGVPTQLLIGHAVVTTGLASTASTTLEFVMPVLLIDTVVVITLMVLLCRRHGESVRELWLGTRPWPGEALRGVALAPVVFLFVVLMLNTLRLVAPWLRDVPVNPLEEIAKQSTGDALRFAVVAIVAGGIREELQRAFMLRRFEQHLGGARAGVVILSVAFGLGHVTQGLDAMITTGAIGAFWAVLYLRRRSVVAPMVSHAAFNSIEVISVALLAR